MFYCETFLHELQSMNFSGQDADAIKVLYTFAYDDLNEKRNIIQALLERIFREKTPDDDSEKSKFISYRLSLLKKFYALTVRMQALKAEIVPNSINNDLTNALEEIKSNIESDEFNEKKVTKLFTAPKNISFETLPEQNFTNQKEFVSDFATHFRNINHLVYTLSDAPPKIKELQTDLSIEILFHISPEEQEAQLQALSDIDLRAMIESSV